MKKRLCVLALSAVLLLSLAACGRSAAEPEAAPASEPEIVRQDGERYEDTINVLGMEETAYYEHIRNEALGFEMDYDYESFERYSGEDYERFVSVWDDPEHIENYLELTRSDEDAESAAAAITEALSDEYDVSRTTRELVGAGSCIRLEAYEIKNTDHMGEHLQVVYLIPASDGCRIATAHYYITEAEGLSRRFSYMLDTLSVIDG